MWKMEVSEIQQKTEIVCKSSSLQLVAKLIWNKFGLSELFSKSWCFARNAWKITIGDHMSIFGPIGNLCIALSFP